MNEVDPTRVLFDRTASGVGHDGDLGLIDFSEFKENSRSR
jgi:hypothetical protein